MSPLHFLTHLEFNINHTLGSSPPLSPQIYTREITPKTEYVSGKSLSAELVYILRRKYDPIFPGNTLVKPPILLLPRKNTLLAVLIDR